jgi:DNA-binding transcriptional ArsR family regulator
LKFHIIQRGIFPMAGHSQSFVDVFKALGDATRLRIILELADGPRSVGALAEALHQPQPTVSIHLGILRTLGLVSRQRKSREVHYSLTSRGRGPKSLAFQAGDGTVTISRP